MSRIPDEPFDVHEPVRIHIPDEDDYDADYDGDTGIVIEILEDDGGSLPGARHELDDYRYVVSIDGGGRFTARHSDLRPATTHH